MVAFFYILALLAVGLSLFPRPPHVPRAEAAGTTRRPLARRDLVLLATLCAMLCVLFALQTALTDRAALSQRPLPAWFLTLPLLFFAPDPPFHALPDRALVEWTQLLAVLESALLLAIFIVVRRIDCRQRSVIALAVLTALCMSALAFGSRVACSDLYAYVAQALVWPHQYAPPAIPFAGDAAHLNFMWGTPIVPSPYGPLWNAIGAIAIAGTHAFWQQTLAFRWLGFASLALCVSCVWRLLGASAAALLFAINPALYDRYLIRANNDLSGVALILLAALARQRTWLAVLLVAAAGTIKLPLLLAGLVVFWDKPSLRQRLGPALCALALGLAASLAFGGVDYIRALQSTYATYDHGPSTVQQALHWTLALVALAAIGLALWRRRFVLGLDWSFLSFGQYPLSQYLAWCLPYVLVGSASPFPFLISWPLLDYALSLEYEYTPFFLVERFLLILGVAAAVGFAVLSRRRQPTALAS